MMFKTVLFLSNNDQMAEKCPQNNIHSQLKDHKSGSCDSKFFEYFA